LRPDSLELARLRDADFSRVPGPDIPTVYPPLVQLVFRAAYFMLRDPVSFKLPFLLAELAIIAMLAAWVRSTEGRNFTLAIYAWNPLMVVEFSATGHFDSIAVALTLAACLLLARKRFFTSTLLLAAAVLAKAFPAVLLPLWLRRAGWPRTKRGWAAAAGAVAVAAACALPYWQAWPVFLGSVKHYASSWRNNNASLAALLNWFSGSHELTVGLGAGIVAGLSLWAAARRMDSVRAAFLLFGAILLLSPNAFAWYFSWIIPFLCFIPSRAWLLLSVLQLLSYHVLIAYAAEGTWHFQPLYLFLCYGPFFAFLLWDRSHTEPDIPVV
jgi:hypothetical protein